MFPAFLYGIIPLVENGMIERIVMDDLVLRKGTVNDLNAVYENIWSDSSLAVNMMWKPCRDIEEAAERLKKTLLLQQERDWYFVALKETDEVIGFAGVNLLTEDIYEDSGIAIASKWQHRGFGHQVVRALKHLVFEQLKGSMLIYGSFRNNEASQALCHSEGFRFLYSRNGIREHDGYQFLADFYYFDRNMYEKEKEIWL